MASAPGSYRSISQSLPSEIATEVVLKQSAVQIACGNNSTHLFLFDALNLLVDVFQQFKNLFRSDGVVNFSILRLQICSSLVYLQIPQPFSVIFERVCAEAFVCWSKLSAHMEDKNVEQETVYWRKFNQLVALLHSVKVYDSVMAFPLSNFVKKKVKEQVLNCCARTYNVGMLDYVVGSLGDVLLSCLHPTFGGADNPSNLEQKMGIHLLHCSYKYFANLRISELFEIIVDFPDSEPALKDLALCLSKVDLKEKLISSLDLSFRKRLLHPGVNTADIITQYVSAIKALRLIDPSGVVLDRVCVPVRDYLFSRDDTVRCIVASLTNDAESDLVEALSKGESIRTAGDEELQFLSWQPDPVDANPDITQGGGQSSDIFSLLVTIYGSCEVFVSEYCNLLADRLLQMCSYDISREVYTLELLKQRFGESSLHFCEVMLKDIAESKRIYSVVSSSSSTEKNMLIRPWGNHQVACHSGTMEEVGITLHEKVTVIKFYCCLRLLVVAYKDRVSGLEIQGMIVSSEFWPASREEAFELPPFVQRKMEFYEREYRRLKGMRRLNWKMCLGMVEIEVGFGVQTIKMTVLPIRAIVLYHFQRQDRWSIDSLTQILKANPSFVRKHIGFWVSQGFLRELSSDVYGLIQEWKFLNKNQMPCEDESLMETDEDSIEAEFQVCWSYITHMLTNLGSLSLERIFSMLKMFGHQGHAKKTLGLNDLKAFLNRKTLQQQLVYCNELYSLSK